MKPNFQGQPTSQMTSAFDAHACQPANRRRQKHQSSLNLCQSPLVSPVASWTSFTIRRRLRVQFLSKSCL